MLFLVALLVTLSLHLNGAEVPEIPVPKLKDLTFDYLYEALKTNAEPPSEGTFGSVDIQASHPSIQLASKLLEDLLTDPTIKGEHFSRFIQNLILRSEQSIGDGSSADGIACYIEQFMQNPQMTPASFYARKIQYYSIKEARLTEDFIEPAYLSAVHNFGVSSDNHYLYALSSHHGYEDQKLKKHLVFTLYNIQTKKVQKITIPIKIPLDPQLRSDQKPDRDDISDYIISYNSDTQNFLLFLPRRNNDSDIFVFCSFNSDKPIVKEVNNALLKNIDYTNNYYPVWQFIEDSIIGASANQYFLYDKSSNIIIPLEYDIKSQRGSYKQNNESKKSPPFMVLKAKINKRKPTIMFIKYILPPSMIPAYQNILNSKTAMIEPPLSDLLTTCLFFDPLNLRYIESKYDRIHKTPVIHIYSIFSEQLTDALKIINQKWLMATKPNAKHDTNFLNDAWYIYHAEKCTDLFLDLESNSPILTKISPELLKIYPIYPLLTNLQKEVILRKRSPYLNEIYTFLTDSQKATILKDRLLERKDIDPLLIDEQKTKISEYKTKLTQTSLRSSWKPVSLASLAKGLRQDIGSFYTRRKYDILGVMTVLGAFAGYAWAGRKLYRWYYPPR
jgi:hypothetical protein